MMFKFLPDADQVISCEFSVREVLRFALIDEGWEVLYLPLVLKSACELGKGFLFWESS